MEAVKTFNNELYSLNDYKPPISKAKMTQITKAAIKAIKFYKHVVQSVEKFIQKCKPEYKVPGLYVIDSIVRQSRHQFGQEKDVFAPRFSNNIINTFQNLYRCPSDDKSKIVRVLNLWQKNKVFKSEIIQPLLDMAAGIPPPVVTHVLPSTAAAVTNTPGTPATPVTPAHIVQGMPDPWIAQMTSTDTLSAVAQILQSPQGQQLQQLVQSLHIQQQKPQPSLLQALDAGLVVQLQALTAQLAAAASNTLDPVEQSLSLSKKLIDRFDFGEANGQNEESNRETPSVLVASVNNSLFHQLAEHLQKKNIENLRHPFLEQQHTPKVTALENQTALSESENSATPSQDDNHLAFLEREEPHRNSINIQQEDMEIEEMQDETEDDLFEKEDEKIVKVEMPRARSKSRSRSPRKRHSRSRSGSRRRKHRKHSRSRSRERKRKTSRSYSSERRAREREKERLKKGLPPIRSKTVSVCSTTLWVGQVDKKATQQDLTNVFEEFGQIESINMIPPRGCAYICMVHRQDAYRALQKLSAGSCKIGSKIIKIAWALNKGVKTEYKQFWDVDLGVTYVPWEKLKLDDLDDFAEGGMIDQETVNNDWSKQKNAEAAAAKETHLVTAPVPITTVPSPVIQKSTVLTQSEAYSQPVAMLQIPVTPSVPAMSLVPPAFPVSMSVPPPGFSTLPPPPFMRAGFNPSQPPPGFIPPHGPPPNIPPISTAIQTALVPRLPISVKSVKDISYGSLILPVGSVATTSASTSSAFDPVSSTEVEKEDERHLPTDNITKRTASDASQSTMVSSAGILSVQPQPPITAPVPHFNMSVRMADMPFLDIRPGLLSQPATARFALLSPTMQPPPPLKSILPPTLNDSALHSLPFSQGDIFSHPSVPGGLNSDVSTQDESTPLPSGSLQQEGDQDYRFPPVENVTIPSEGEQKKESLAVANKENKLVTPAEEMDIKIRHIQDDHDPQDMALVDFDGKEKFPESGIGHLSVESSHEPEREVKAQSLDSVRSSDIHLYESKLGNSHEFHGYKLKSQLEGRQQFGSSLLDILPKFGKHPQEVRKMFGRLPPEAHFGRLIPESHISRLPIESKDQFGRPIIQDRNNFGQSSVDGREHFSRPPLGNRDHFGRLIADDGRQQQFNSDKPWGHRGDFDERHLSFPGFSSAKGFQDERHVNYRPEPRSGLGWNREFDLDASRDFDDSHHPWERHRDRDDRDLSFRREVNGNRFERVRQSNNWIQLQSKFVDFSVARVTNQKEDDIPQVNGDMPDQPETIKYANNFELCEQESSGKVIKENDAKNAEVECQPVVESTENVET